MEWILICTLRCADGISRLPTCDFNTRNLARMGTNLERARIDEAGIRKVAYDFGAGGD